MKKGKMLIVSALVALFSTGVFGQNAVEKIVPLSKNAAKGYFYNAIQDEGSGNIEVSYKFKSKGKDDPGTYETYIFDKDLNLVNQEESTTPKKDIEDKKDYSSSVVWASIGGCTSGTILSLDLHLSKLSFNYTWNKNKKGYDAKRTENVEIKPSNDQKRTYDGYASYTDKSTGNLMVLASSVTKVGKETKKDFVMLDVKTDLSVKEIALPLDASQLVYCGIINNSGEESLNEDDISSSDMYFIFAPTFKKGSTADYKTYSFLRIDKNGVIKENVKIASPSPNLIFNACLQDKDGSLYLSGCYNNQPKVFDELYGEYVPIVNPCYTDGPNVKMASFEKKTESMKMDFFCILKLKGAKVEWIKSNPIADIAKVIKTPPNQKKSTEYAGNGLHIEYFNVLKNGDILITGQLKSREILGTQSVVNAYKDVICLQFSPSGEIKAQYSINTESIKEKLNTMFMMPQNFIFSDDGQTLYWNLLETKATKGYASFYDAYNNYTTYYANYYPSMVKINTKTSTIEEYNVFGDHKFLLNKNVPFIYNQKDNTIIYIGSDGNGKLWLSKYLVK